ncbi:MAG: Ig-like domain-containing protein [Lachnospiraceae bacterium]|nr:Ig-like domain-containing protein [Lachnospiraceae bacterium]
MIQNNFTDTMWSWRDGSWFEFEYSNDGGNTWDGVRVEVKQGYAITNNTAADANGFISVSEYAIAGETVTLNVSPADGYMLDAVTVTDGSGNNVTVENNQFTMPASAVTVNATFKTNPKYNITINASENGSVSADMETATAGTTVTLTVKPDEGYELDALTINDGAVTAVKGEEGKYTFAMPASAVTVTVTFKMTHLRHDYTAVFNWADDYSQATATVTCGKCSAKGENLPATVTRTETGSEYVYTATVTFDGETFTDTRSVNKPGGSSGEGGSGGSGGNSGGSGGGGGYSGGGGSTTQPQTPAEEEQKPSDIKPEPPQEQKPSDIKPEQPEKTEKPDTLSSVNKLITGNKLDKIENVSYVKLQPQATGSKKAVTITWKKVKDADGYVIYGAESTKTLKKLKTVKAQETSYSNKNLKTGKAYQYIVVAYKTVDGKKYVISVSEEIYACTNGKTYANPTGIKLASTKVTLQKGKTKTLKPSLVLPKGKKYQAHTDKFRYESSNSSVATVTKKGVVKAKKKGTAYIYIYTTNGVCKKVKVTVK